MGVRKLNEIKRYY